MAGAMGAPSPPPFYRGMLPEPIRWSNVSEDAHALYVTALAPGLEPTAIQLTVQDNRLTIAGEKPRVAAEVQPEAFHRSERAAGKFVRTVTLPIDVEHAQVQADYTHGLLVVTLPKAEQAKPKQIAVSVTG